MVDAACLAVGPAGHSGVTAATVRISEDKVRDLQMWSRGWYYRLATGWVIIYNCTYYGNDLYVLMLVTWGSAMGIPSMALCSFRKRKRAQACMQFEIIEAQCYDVDPYK